MKIGVYVGSFNPIHKGHKAITDFLLANKYVDKIEIIPTGNYWGKNDLIAINHRIKMLKLYETDNIIVNTDLNNLEYTYQILRKLKIKYKLEELYLIIGSDNLPKLNLWKESEELLQYKIIVIPRNNMKINEYKKIIGNKKNFILINNFHEIDISSTNIRELIKNNDTHELTKMLDKKILDYINENNLYEE